MYRNAHHALFLIVIKIEKKVYQLLKNVIKITKNNSYIIVMAVIILYLI